MRIHVVGKVGGVQHSPEFKRAAIIGRRLHTQRLQRITAQTIRMEFTRASGTVIVRWPLAAAQCTQVLRDLLR
jgi:hypothetical protein